MATGPLRADSARVITPNQFPPAVAVRVAHRMLARFNRDEIGTAIEVLVELLDSWDGDPDSEETDAEDDFTKRLPKRWDGPGCTIADPDQGADDEGEQAGDEDDWCDYRASGPGCPISDPGGCHEDVIGAI